MPEQQSVMADQDNLAVARGYFEALRSGDTARLGTLFADDIVWHQPGSSRLSGTYRGKDEVFSLFRRFMEISGGSFRIDRVDALMANGDLVSTILRFRAEQGKHRMAMDGVDLMRIEGGRIREMWLFSGDPEAEDCFWGQ